MRRCESAKLSLDWILWQNERNAPPPSTNRLDRVAAFVDGDAGFAHAECDVSDEASDEAVAVVRCHSPRVDRRMDRLPTV